MFLMLKFISILVIFLTLGTRETVANKNAICEHDPHHALTELLQEILNDAFVPSIAGAIIKNDTIYAAAVGHRMMYISNEEEMNEVNEMNNQTHVVSEHNVTLCDRYHLGSDTKAFTSLLVGMMVEEGKLHWESTLGTVFSAAQDDIQIAKGYENITIVQLLSHTSGLPFDDDNMAFNTLINGSYFQPGNLNDARRAIFRNGMTSIPVNQTQKGTFAYSNFGYIILGCILEHLTDTTWEQLITKRIFLPLQFQHAGLGCQVSPGLIDAPLPHIRAEEKEIEYFLSGPNCDNPLVMGPAGTAHMSILDFAQWARFQLNNGTLQPDADGEYDTGLRPIVTPETIAYLHERVVTMEISDPAPGTPPSGGYAKGWGIIQPDFSKEPILFHGGSNEKNLAYIFLDVKRNFGMVLVTNMGGEYADAVLKNATVKMWGFGMMM